MNFESKKQSFHRTAGYLEDTVRESNNLLLMGMGTTAVGIYEFSVPLLFGGLVATTVGLKKLTYDTGIYGSLLTRRYAETRELFYRLRKKLKGSMRLRRLQRDWSIIRERYETIQ